MDWYELTNEYHSRARSLDGDLADLSEEWMRELAAIWRAEADINNGAYLQFITNWGRPSYEYASQAFRKIGAKRMAEIVDQCQALLDEHYTTEGKSWEELTELMPNPVLGNDGKPIKDKGSVLPNDILKRIYELSYEFMDYPDNLEELGMRYYAKFVDADK